MASLYSIFTSFKIRYTLCLLEKVVNPSHSNNLGYKEPENKMTQSVYNTRFQVFWLMQEISP